MFGYDRKHGDPKPYTDEDVEKHLLFTYIHQLAIRPDEVVQT